MFDTQLMGKAEEILSIGRERHLRIAAAESCTGGLIAALLTEIPGSASVIGRSFVTYSNRAKREVLGVDVDILKEHGAVSEAVVRAMARNTFDMTTAHLTVAVSGVAGPGGGSDDKPVGTVHMATAMKDDVIHQCCQFGDIGRSAVRIATVHAATDMLLDRLKN